MSSVQRISISVTWQPAYWASVIGVVMMLMGFGVLMLGWRGAAALLDVAFQVPYGVSGGVSGLALIGFGAALVNLQTTRRLAARDRARTTQAVQQASHLLALAHAADRPSPEEPQ